MTYRAGLQRHALGLLAVAAALAATLAIRAAYLEPAAWGAACIVAMPPIPCLPRAAMLWLQHWQLWGAAALACGILALRGAPFAIPVAAVALGAVAVASYNTNLGMLGLTFGAWAWIEAPASA